MKILIENYTFDASEGTIAFEDYISDGILLERVLLVTNSRTKEVLFDFLDPTYTGSVAANVLTVDTDTTEMLDADGLMILYNDPNAAQKIENTLPLDKDDDSVTMFPAPTTAVPLNVSGIVAALPKMIKGFLCNTTGGGTVRLWDNASAASGTALGAAITPVAGQFYPLGDFEPTNGVYAQITGTLDLTFYRYT
jgi:hypothetical protein